LRAVRFTCYVAAAAAAAVAAPIRGDAAEKAPGPLARAVDDLGAEEWARRWKASAAIRSAGAKGQKAALEWLRGRSLAETSPREAHDLVRDLSSKDWAVRDKASRRLLDMGRAALPALKKAAASDDLETGFRARDLIDKIGTGALAGDLMRTAECLKRSPSCIVLVAGTRTTTSTAPESVA